MNNYARKQVSTLAVPGVSDIWLPFYRPLALGLTLELAKMYRLFWHYYFSHVCIVRVPHIKISREFHSFTKLVKREILNFGCHFRYSVPLYFVF